MSTATLPPTEVVETFPCFGTTCTVIVQGPGPAGTAAEATVRSRRRLLGWHDQLSRFLADSEFSRFNADPRETVPVSSTTCRFVRAAVDAAQRTGGLVDPTLTDAIERAGYAADLLPPELPLAEALRLAPARSPGRPAPDPAWRRVTVDLRASTVTRPVGVRLDSGSIAKGLLADVLASPLKGHERFVVDLGGDVRIGGTGAVRRAVDVGDPFGGHEPVHRFVIDRGAVATSGIGRRRWIGPDGTLAHHLLDPATGRPAFTGLVQVTALAPTALAAEALAKAALLAGPNALEQRLPHGGVAVLDDGTSVVR